jgi:MoaA/NifB/PqqE/SkfB family radical SAM enzyme
MDKVRLAELAWKHTRNAASEELYLKTGFDTTKPVVFYGLVNERCNVKCRYCEHWRQKHYVDEMSIADWQNALLSIKEFVGKFSISFSGGEPFIKQGFVDLLGWCHEHGISAGATTNGSALTPRNAAKVVAAHPFNINISVDAPNAEVHDYLRGYPGLFDKLSSGIRHLIKERKRQGIDFPIIIKPTVNVRNYRYLPELVKWTEEIGATCVNLQPMGRWTPETYDELWIEEEELPEFQRVVDQLCTMARRGAPIMTSEMMIALMPDHFREKKAPPEVMPCRVGLRDFFIKTNGDVEVCFYYPSIGNIREQSAREIWYGPKANEIRKQTVACDRLCLFACLSQKTLTDKVKMGLKLLNRKERAAPLGDGNLGDGNDVGVELADGKYAAGSKGQDHAMTQSPVHSDSRP